MFEKSKKDEILSKINAELIGWVYGLRGLPAGTTHRNNVEI